MKTKLEKKLNISFRAARKKRGSGIVTVLVTMIFLFSICSSLLMTTYTGFQMNVSRRAGNEALAQATSAMDEIRVALQTVVSECTKNAYNRALVHYSYAKLNISEKFGEYFYEELKNYDVNGPLRKELGALRDASGNILYGVDDLDKICPEKYLVDPAKNDEPVKKYDINAIKFLLRNSHYEGGNEPGFNTASSGKLKISNLVKQESDINIDDYLTTTGVYVETNSSDVQDWMFPASEKREYGVIILENISVTSVVGNNREKITADIKIGTPDLGDNFTNEKAAELSDFAVIAADDIVIYNANVNYSGSIYAKSLMIQGSGSFSIDGVENQVESNAVFKNGINIYGDSREKKAGENGEKHSESDYSFGLGKNAKLWTDGIITNYNSGALLKGDTYFQNSINLLGEKSFVKVTGNLFGFGTGLDTNYGTDEIYPEKSSSILINGRKSELDMSEIESLTIAGYALLANDDSFYSESTKISTFITDDNNNVMLGQSIANKEEQQIYLAPVEMLKARIRVRTEKANSARTGTIVTYNDSGAKTTITSNPEIVNISITDDQAKEYLTEINQQLDADYQKNELIYAKQALAEQELYKKNAYLETTDILGNGKDYGATVKKMIFNVGNSNYIIYYYLTFDTVDHRNQFYRDYFELYPEKLMQYINDYCYTLSFGSAENDPSCRIVGNALVIEPNEQTKESASAAAGESGTGTEAENETALTTEQLYGVKMLRGLSESEAARLVNVEAPYYEKEYENLTEILKLTGGTEGQDPYSYYVNNDAIDTYFNLNTSGDSNCVAFDANGNKRFYSVTADGEHTQKNEDTGMGEEVLRIYKNGNQELTIHPEDLGKVTMVIATGSIKFEPKSEYTYEGTIMTGGELTLGTNLKGIKSNAIAFENALEAMENAGIASNGDKITVEGSTKDAIMMHMPIDSGVETTEEGEAASTSNWQTSGLGTDIRQNVVYSNWIKE